MRLSTSTRILKFHFYTQRNSIFLMRFWKENPSLFLFLSFCVSVCFHFNEWISFVNRDEVVHHWRPVKVFASSKFLESIYLIYLKIWNLATLMNFRQWWTTSPLWPKFHWIRNDRSRQAQMSTCIKWSLIIYYTDFWTSFEFIRIFFFEFWEFKTYFMWIWILLKLCLRVKIIEFGICVSCVCVRVFGVVNIYVWIR